MFLQVKSKFEPGSIPGSSTSECLLEKQVREFLSSGLLFLLAHRVTRLPNLAVLCVLLCRVGIGYGLETPLGADSLRGASSKRLHWPGLGVAPIAKVPRGGASGSCSSEERNRPTVAQVMG